MDNHLIKIGEPGTEDVVMKAALHAESIAFLHVQTECAKLRLREQQAIVAEAEAAIARKTFATYGCAALILLSWSLHFLLLS